MIEKLTRLAETVATSCTVSRRAFMRSLGQRALAVAVAVGAVLVFPKDARAGPPATGACCYSGACHDGFTQAQCLGVQGTYMGDGTTCTGSVIAWCAAH